MRKEYAVKDATLVYTKDELGYAPLLEEMQRKSQSSHITSPKNRAGFSTA